MSERTEKDDPDKPDCEMVSQKCLLQTLDVNMVNVVGFSIPGFKNLGIIPVYCIWVCRADDDDDDAPWARTPLVMVQHWADDCSAVPALNRRFSLRLVVFYAASSAGGTRSIWTLWVP